MVNNIDIKIRIKVRISAKNIAENYFVSIFQWPIPYFSCFISNNILKIATILFLRAYILPFFLS